MDSRVSFGSSPPRSPSPPLSLDPFVRARSRRPLSSSRVPNLLRTLALSPRCSPSLRTLSKRLRVPQLQIKLWLSGQHPKNSALVFLRAALSRNSLSPTRRLEFRRNCITTGKNASLVAPPGFRKFRGPSWLSDNKCGGNRVFRRKDDCIGNDIVRELGCGL